MSIRFSAIGFAHNHIFSLVDVLQNAGAQLCAYFDDVPDRIAEFQTRYPHAHRAESIDAILQDASIDLIVSAAIPDQRAPLGIQAMQNGKDFLSAKPAFTSLSQLDSARAVQAQTGQIYAIYFGERFGNRATVKAAELVQANAIGQVIQTVGFGPHRLLGHNQRPDWVFDRVRFGGIINDLASHQIDQFLFFTGSQTADIVSANVGNFGHPQFPKMHDFGDLTLRGERATGYIRVDWLTPQGLDTWGDVRLFILGSDGYIELRKNIDIAGHAGTDHLLLVNHEGTRRVECQAIELPFGRQFLDDVRHRTQTAVRQDHCFRVSELALKAEQLAVTLTPAE